MKTLHLAVMAICFNLILISPAIGQAELEKKIEQCGFSEDWGNCERDVLKTLPLICDNKCKAREKCERCFERSVNLGAKDNWYASGYANACIGAGMKAKYLDLKKAVNDCIAGRDGTDASDSAEDQTPPTGEFDCKASREELDQRADEIERIRRQLRERDRQLRRDENYYAQSCR